MEKVEIFTIITYDECWIKNQILDFNKKFNSNFKFEKMLNYEVVFAEISTFDNYETIFEFAKFVSEQQTKEYIEGKI